MTEKPKFENLFAVCGIYTGSFGLASWIDIEFEHTNSSNSTTRVTTSSTSTIDQYSYSIDGWGSDDNDNETSHIIADTDIDIDIADAGVDVQPTTDSKSSIAITAFTASPPKTHKSKYNDSIDGDLYLYNSKSNSNSNIRRSFIVPNLDPPTNLTKLILKTPSTPSSRASANNTASLLKMEDTARQHYIIGDNLRHKGFYEDSVIEFQKSLDIRSRLLGEWHLETGKTYYALGLSQRALKDYPAALLHLAKAAQCLEQEDNIASDPAIDANRQHMLIQVQLNIARTHHTQAVDLQRLGRYDASIKEHRKALAIREVHLGKEHLETARTYYCMGCALSDRGDFDEAVADLRRALKLRYQIFGPDHLDTHEVMQNIAIVLIAKGNMDVADVEEYKQMLPTILQTELEGDAYSLQAQAEQKLEQDATTPETDTAENETKGKGGKKGGKNKKKNKNKNKDTNNDGPEDTGSNWEKAMAHYKNALGLEQSSLGDLHPATCDLHLKIAECLGEMKCLEASLSEYRRAISIYEELLGKFHIKVASIYSRLGNILLEKGEYETALSFFAKSYGIFDSTVGNHPDTIQALINIRIAAEKERGAMNSMDILKRAEQQKIEAAKVGALRTEMPTPPSSPKKNGGRRKSKKKGGDNKPNGADKTNGNPEPVGDII